MLVALGLSLRQTALYRSTAQVFVSTSALSSSLEDVPLLSSDPVRVLATQADVARVPEVARLAAKDSAEDITGDELLSQSSVISDSGADILEFTVTDEDPDRAQSLANAYAAGYVDYRRNLDTRSLAKAREELQQQIDELQAGAAPTDGEAPAPTTTPTTSATTTTPTTTAPISTAADRAIADLVDQSQSLRTKELLQAENSTLGGPATDPEKIQPHPVQSAVLGGVIGLILGIALVFVRDALNTRVRTAEEIEARLGIPLLGRIPPPHKRLGDDELSALIEPYSEQAEAFRMLATSIELVNLDRGAKSIMIASALGGEGKSTTTASLGVTFARRGYHVAVIEADVRKPTLSKLFGLEPGAGLSDVVLGRLELEDALRTIDMPADPAMGSNGASASPTPVGRLEVLLSGPTPPSPPEFLKSRAVADVVESLTNRADLLLIDTPPLLHLSDVTTMMLSAQIDCVAAAVRLGAARRHSVDELRRVLESAPVVKLGFFTTNARGGGDAYGYGYSQGAARQLPPAADPPALAREG